MLNKFFLKRFKHILQIILIPSIVLFAFIIMMISISMLRNIDSSVTSSSEDIATDFATVTSSCFSQQDLLTLNVQMSLIMKKSLKSAPSTYTEYIFIKSVSTFLNSVVDSNPSIHSIYLYLDGYETFLSSEKTLVPFSSDTDKTGFEEYNKMDTDANTLMVTRTIPADINSGKLDVLTIYKRLSYLDGVIVANLPLDNLRQKISGKVSVANSNIYFFTENNHLLFCTELTDSEPLSSSLSKNLSSCELNSPQWIKLNNHLYRIYLERIDDYGLQYAIVTPVSTLISEILGQLLWPIIMLFAIVILIFLLAFINTKESFKQIQYVIDLFADAEKGIYSEESPTKEPDNEYELIMNNVIRLFLNTTFLNTQLIEQKYERRAAELEALQLQINPHFIINTLQTVNFELYKVLEGPSDINTIMNNFSDILSYSLTKESAPITVNDEINYIHKYVEIQKFRFAGCFIYYEDIDDTSLLVPFKRLLLQPLIENSISHGIRPSSKTGLIKVKIFTRNDMLYVSVLDSGNGMSKAKLSEIQSQLADNSSPRIGLFNVNKRLILSYGEESALHIQSKEGYGTIVTFHIPL